MKPTFYILLASLMLCASAVAGPVPPKYNNDSLYVGLGYQDETGYITEVWYPEYERQRIPSTGGNFTVEFPSPTNTASYVNVYIISSWPFSGGVYLWEATLGGTLLVYAGTVPVIQGNYPARYDRSVNE